MEIRISMDEAKKILLRHVKQMSDGPSKIEVEFDSCFTKDLVDRSAFIFTVEPIAAPDGMTFEDQLKASTFGGLRRG